MAPRRSHVLRDEAANDIGDGDPFGAGGEGERHAVAENGLGEGGDVVGGGRDAAVEQGAGAGGEHEGLTGARARAPGDLVAHAVGGRRFGARAAGEPIVGTVLVTGAAGWAFGWLADRSGSIVAPALAHLAINEAGAIAAVALQRRYASGGR